MWRSSASRTMNSKPSLLRMAPGRGTWPSASDVHALGSHERVTVYYGASSVQARLRVASADTHLDELTTSGALFQVVASLRHGEAARSVAFDDCVITGKEFAMATGGHGETVYEFTATRVREEAAEASEG
jgi:hypothetical protein